MTTPDSLQARPLRLIAQELRNASTRSADLVAIAEAQYAARGGIDHAYVRWSGDAARRQAELADSLLAAGIDTGALMGLPLSIKDVFGVAGHEIRAGTAEPLPETWSRPGPVVRQSLRQVPAMVGKTHTVPFAFGALGTSEILGSPRNPRDPVRHRAPGGSSSGAGVSVASGTARIAFGTDTHGSVRIPASLTGVTGLKITKGRWSAEGIVPLSHTLDTPGLLTASVDDLSYTFAAIDGDGLTLDEVPVPELSTLRVGVPEHFFWDGCDPGITEAVEGALSALVSAGLHRVPREMPNAQVSHEMFRNGGVAATELAAFLAAELPGARDRLEPNVAARLAAAEGIPATEYVRRRSEILRMSREALAAFEGVDALLWPTVAATPPVLDEIRDTDTYARTNMLTLRNVAVVNFMGLAALTLPVGQDAAGMPVGLQIVVPPMQERRLLAIGRAVERLLGTPLDILGTPPLPERRAG